MILISLPYPPTVNNYWGFSRKTGKQYVTTAGKNYRTQVLKYLTVNRVGKTLQGRLGCRIEVNPPDKRRRDLDNVLKAALDAMEAGGVYLNDCQIDDLHVVRGTYEKGGRLNVRVYEIEP